jgi:hypothetical protein
LTDGAWVAGKFGYGLDFGTTPGYVQVPTDPTLESQTITAEAWVKHSGSPGTYKYILAKGASTSGGCARGS